MAIQFGTRTLLYLMACVGTWFTCVSAVIAYHQVNWSDAIEFTIVTSPVWLPTLVLAYAFGCGEFTTKTLAAFVAAGPIGLGISLLVKSVLFK